MHHLLIAELVFCEQCIEAAEQLGPRLSLILCVHRSLLDGIQKILLVQGLLCLGFFSLQHIALVLLGHLFDQQLGTVQMSHHLLQARLLNLGPV